MQRQTLAGGKTDHQRPVLPANRIALDLEARPLGLDDLQGLDAGALRRDALGRIIAGQRRQIAMGKLVDLHHLHRVQIDHRPDALDRPGIAVVARVAAQKAERPGQPPAHLVGIAIKTGRPDVDHHQRRVVGAEMLFEQCAEFLTVDHRLLALDLLVDRHRRLHAGNVPARDNTGLAERDDRLEAAIRVVVEKNRLSRTGQLDIAVMSVDRSLVRFHQRDRDEAGGRRDLVRLRNRSIVCWISSAVRGSSGWVTSTARLINHRAGLEDREPESGHYAPALAPLGLPNAHRLSACCRSFGRSTLD